MKTVKLDELLKGVTPMVFDIKDDVYSASWLRVNKIYALHAANVLPDLVAEQRFILGEIAIASCETDECKLSIMNELIRCSPGFTALIHAEKVNIPE